MRRIFMIFVAVFTALSIPGDALSEVKFEGNYALSDMELKNAIDLDSKPDEVNKRIKEMYQNLGYFDVEIENDYIDRSQDRIIIIKEGRQSRISAINLEVSPDSIRLILEDVANMYGGFPASQGSFMEFAEDCLRILSEHGMPFARGEWAGFALGENNDVIANFKIIPGPLSIVSNIAFNGISRTRPQTLKKASGLNTGVRYSREHVLRSEKLIGKLPYVEISSPFYLETSKDGDSCTVVYNIRELPSTSFEGFGGLIDNPGGTDFVGRLDIEFGDILGTGRMFSLYWNKKDTRSNELSIKYLEPFIFNSRIDLEAEVFQLDRDTLFVTTGGKIAFIHRFGIDLTGELYGSVERTVPESGSEISRSIRRAIGTSFNYVKTDHDTNPRAGYEIGTGLEYRYRSNGLVAEGRNPPSNLTSAGLDGAVYIGLSRRIVAAILLKSWGIVSSNGEVPADEFEYVGGIRNLRGYTEERFPAYRYIIPSIEPRLLSGKNSRIYLFEDFGFIKASQEARDGYRFKPGYGLGLVTGAGIGRIRVEIGWGEENFPDGAVLNFSVGRRF